jgi:hypothetical protein
MADIQQELHDFSLNLQKARLKNHLERCSNHQQESLGLLPCIAKH